MTQDSASWWPLAIVVPSPLAAVLLDPREPLGAARAGTLGLMFVVSVAALPLFGLAGSLGVSGTGAGVFLAGLPLVLVFPLLARLAALGATVAVLGGGALWTAALLVGSALGDAYLADSATVSLLHADLLLSGIRAQTPIANLLGVGGTTLVTFLVACVGISLGLAWAERANVMRRGRAMVVGAMVVIVVVGLADLGAALAPPRSPSSAVRETNESDPIAVGEPMRIVLVQPGAAWSSAAQAERFDGMVELTRTVDGSGAALLLWPSPRGEFGEEAGSASSSRPSRVEVLRALARERGVAILVAGEHLAEAEPSGMRESAFLFPADGGAVRSVRAVPNAAPVLSDEAAPEPLTLAVKGWRVGPLLGSPASLAKQALLRVAAGADFLVDLSARPASSAQAERDLARLSILAAQSRRSVARTTEAGVTALVAANGLLSWRLPVGSPSAALLDVIPPSRDAVYHRGGGFGVELLVWILALAATLLPVALKKTGRQGAVSAGGLP